MLQKKTLFLIDAHALIYRSYFAIRSLTTSQGQATNAVYGFITTLKKIVRNFKPDYLAVCFDSKGKTARQERFSEYKIHRRPMPDDLISQVPLVKDVVSAYHLPIFELSGFEADDLIATLTKYLKENLQVVIVSDDKDMLQLLDKNVSIYSVRKDLMMGEKEAREIFGIKSKHITDFISLAGDQTDNIPGVVGFGEVTARNLINEYGTLENILKNLDQIKPDKVREKLKEQTKMAVFSKELAILDSNVPIKIDLEQFKVGEPDHNRLYQIFKDLEFKKLLEDLPIAPPPNKTISIKTLTSVGDTNELFSAIEKKGEVAFLLSIDDGVMFPNSEVLLSIQEGEVWRLQGEAMEAFATILADKKVTKITHDLKAVLKLLFLKSWPLEGKAFDCLLAGYLISPVIGTFSIESLAWSYLKASWTDQDRRAHETESLLQLYKVLSSELKAKSLVNLFEEIEIPLAEVLAKIEREGVRLDLRLLNQLSAEADKKIQALVKQIYGEAKCEFNLNSPRQLATVLFEQLKLAPLKKTKTGFSTDEEVLSKLAKLHPIAAMILEYRQIAKLKSTYIDALPKLINPETGRVHALFHQTGAETGRLSSSEPNLQNIPIRTEFGREIRKAFIPQKADHLIVSADYSQIELRILAHLSQDKNLIKAFKEDQDIHTYTSAQIFDIPESEVTSQMRYSAKRVNFGIIYGMSAFGLSKDLDIPQSEAQLFIDKYFLRYPDVKKFMDEQIARAEKDGYVLTLLNRRRYLPEIHSANSSLRQFAQRQAINTPVQGSAADLIKLAMIQIQNDLEEKAMTSRMIITVHDELVFDVPESELMKAVVLVRGRMEEAIALSVPVKVTVKTGKNWLQTEEEKR